MLVSLIQNLDQVLGQLIQQLNILVECLKKEREVIIDYNLNEIIKVTQEKQQCLLAIQAIERERAEIVAQISQELGLKATLKMEKLLDYFPSEYIEVIKDRLSCVKSLAQAVQEFNESQRQYLEHSLKQVQQSLDLIQNLQGRGTNPGYTKDGSLGQTKKESVGMVNRTV